MTRAINDGIWEWDIEADRAFYSPRFCAMLGAAAGSLGPRLSAWLDRVHPEDRPSFERELEAHLQVPEGVFAVEHRVETRRGEYRWMLARGVAERHAPGAARRMAGSLSDSDDQKKAQEQLRHDAFHDKLTGLANRALYLERVNRLLGLARRGTRYGFSVVVVDIDGFSLYNHSLGVGGADELLATLGERLRGLLRASDTVARLSGDRYGIIFEESRLRAQVLQAAERIAAALGDSVQVGGREVALSFGIGVAEWAPGYAHGEQMLRDAEIALKRAKAHGRGSIEIYDNDARREPLALLELERAVRHALKNREFRVYYQPIVETGTRTVVGFEGLVRWERPGYGVLAPGAFLDFVEANGFIVALGEQVIEQGCEQLARWERMRPGLRLHLNVSATQLMIPSFVAKLRERLTASGADPRSLKLELTEQVLLDDTEAAVNSLRALRESGVGLAMDDFGTGYSSLHYLQQFPFDTIKIDRRFIGKVTTDRTSEHLVRAILGLGAGLTLAVIAEGVETEEQLAALRGLGCALAQGYLFAYPMPPQAATELLERARL